MNAISTIVSREKHIPLLYHPVPPATAPPKTRVALFGSFLGGYHILKELLAGEFPQRITVTGIATDDPIQPFTHPNVRLWKYPHTQDDEMLVLRFAQKNGLPVFTGRVKTPDFYEMFFNQWKPDLCLMATFGQKIPKALIDFPKIGFYNFHHSGDKWPSYPGPDPIATMVRDGQKHLVLTIHEVTEVIDGGKFVARSHQITIPDGVNAIAMHRITWPQMGPFIRCEIGALLNTASVGKSIESPLTLREPTTTYRVANSLRWADPIADIAA